MIPVLGIGAVFSGLGATVAFGRSGARFDRRKLPVTQWFKVLLLARVKETPLSGFDQLVIDEHLWKGTPRYSLCLAGQSNLEILITRRGHDILELAERLSSWLTLPINSHSGTIEELAAQAS